jgi:transaldolase
MAIDGASLLLPLFKPDQWTGRISIQTNTKNFNNTDRLLEQSIHFASLAPNIQVKIPATTAGLTAIEEATFKGVSINATVSYSVPQAIAVAEAVERGLNRRTALNLEIDSISPICTIMVGRLDDWLKYVVERDQIRIPAIDPEVNVPNLNPLTPMDFAGIACMKKAYNIYSERGYRTRLLTAAYRHQGHWTSFIGGNLSMTMPYRYQTQFNRSNAEITSHIDEQIPHNILSILKEIPDFVKAYDGMPVDEFDYYGPVNKTLEQFAQGYDDLIRIIRRFFIKY